MPAGRQSVQAVRVKRLHRVEAHLAHLVEVLQSVVVDPRRRVTLVSAEKAERGVVRALLPQQRQKLVDLLVVCHVVLRKHTLYLLEVPVWDARHLINLFEGLANVPVLAVRPIDAETVAVVVTGAIRNVPFALLESIVALAALRMVVVLEVVP